MSHISLFEIFINPIDATQHFNLRYSLVTVQLPFYDLWPLELPRRLLSSLNLHPLQIPIAELLPDGHVMRRPTIIQIINICSMFLTSVNSLPILAARYCSPKQGGANQSDTRNTGQCCRNSNRNTCSCRKSVASYFLWCSFR